MEKLEAQKEARLFAWIGSVMSGKAIDPKTIYPESFKDHEQRDPDRAAKRERILADYAAANAIERNAADRKRGGDQV